MEVVGVTFAVASLTFQLVDGVDRFQTFFEECRDPTINVQDLVGQLKAVRQLLQILEREATKPGSESELTGATFLQDELCRSKCRLQELTNLVTKFEAGSYPPLADRNGGKVRLKNYFKLHSQQKKIRRYAEKLDRTRATVIDHLHVTIMSQVSDLHSEQQNRQRYRDSELKEPGDTGTQLVSYQQGDKGTVATRSPMATDVPNPAANQETIRQGRVFNINHRGGAAMFNTDIKQTVKNVQAGAAMFDQAIGKPSTTPRSSQPVTTPQHQQNSNNEQSEACPSTPARFLSTAPPKTDVIRSRWSRLEMRISTRGSIRTLKLLTKSR